MLQSFAGGRLFGERFGSADPWILALHGWQRSHRDFQGVFPALPHGDPPVDALAAIALDLPGFGTAPDPPEAWGSCQYAQHLGPVLEEMAEQVVLVGHSFGGRIAPYLASQHRRRVAGIVLTGVPFVRSEHGPIRPKASYRAVRALAHRGLVSDHRLERARQRHGSPDYRAAQGVMRAVLVRVLGEDYEEILRELDVPVELLWGELDTVAPPAAAHWAAQRIANAHVQLLPGIDHLVPTAAPEALRDALRRLRP